MAVLVTAIHAEPCCQRWECPISCRLDGVDARDKPAHDGYLVERYAFHNTLESRKSLPELPLAVAFRNMLIHGYATVDDATVWRSVNEDLPCLRDRVTALLDELGCQG